MTTEKLAPEELEAIAAFIDGRMSEAEREGFMARLDSREVLYEVFVETVRARSTPSRRSRPLARAHGWRSIGRSGVLAAGLILAVAAAVLFRGVFSSSYSELLLASGAAQLKLEPGWYEQPWSSLRGEISAADNRKTAFRAGVRIVDLEVALSAGRSVDARILTRRLEQDLRGVDGAEPLRLGYLRLAERLENRAIGGDDVRTAESLERGAKSLLETNPYLALGCWTETGRLAAQAGNTRLLSSRSYRQSLDTLMKEPWPPEILGLLTRVRELLGGRPEDADLRALGDLYSAVLAQG